MTKQKKKIVVAMSGGVDSSVAAFLLKKEGFIVSGVFMRLFLSDSREEEERAKIVAQKLDIPFSVIDISSEFKKSVIDTFVKDYYEGRTPNPCVGCNKEIKMGLLLNRVLDMGVDFMATGHYIRKIKNESQYELFRGLDKKKDQSYFLWKLGQKELQHLVFPLGEYTKTKVKKIAENISLEFHSSKLKESMEVCFIKKSLNDFLLEKIGRNEGDIVDINREKIGNHFGLWFYTIGQRRGIGLAGGPYFVIEKDYEKNILVVSKEKKDLRRINLKIKDISWVSNEVPTLPIEASVQIRYAGKDFPATINREGVFYVINFDKPQESTASGQSVVIYQNEKLLGGGIVSAC